jgi:hypothetical protein
LLYKLKGLAAALTSLSLLQLLLDDTGARKAAKLSTLFVLQSESIGTI